MLKRLRNLTVPPGIEQRAALLDGRQITYTLKRSSKRRSIGLNIDERGLTVSVPMRSSERWLKSVLQEKAGWVIQKLDVWQQVSLPAETCWADGESISYLGELLCLRVVPSLFVTPAIRKDRELCVYVVSESDPDCIEAAASNWYRCEAKRLFSERVAHYAPLLNVAPSAVNLSSAKTQWGCCTAQGMVRLNLQLIKLPLRLIDYVVVHELAHLREMNHSAKFWDVVEMACADYVELRNELKTVYMENT